MEPWRKAWRDYLAPAIPLAGLKALQAALDVADVHLRQGLCILPLPRWNKETTRPRLCCPLYYGLWKGYSLDDVADVIDVADVALESDAALERMLSPRATFMLWFDSGDFTDRCVELCEEVTVTIFNRQYRLNRSI